MKTVILDNETLTVREARYQDGGRLAVTLTDADGLPYSTVTTNLPDVPDSKLQKIADAHEKPVNRLVFVRGDGFYKEALNQLLEQGALKGPYGYAPSGYITIGVYYWTL
jgi:hypothetical protein